MVVLEGGVGGAGSQHEQPTDGGRLPRTVYGWAQRVENLSLQVLDVGIIAAAWCLAYGAGFEFQVPAGAARHATWFIGLPLIIQILANRMAGLYGPIWRYASVEEGARVIAAVAAGAVLSLVSLTVVSQVTGFQLPLLTAPAVAALLMLLGCGGIRFQSRFFALERQRTTDHRQVRSVIVGAGSAGVALAYELNHTDAGRGVAVVGFIDDDRGLANRSLRGIPVLGTTLELGQICRHHRVDRILIALPEASTEHHKAVVSRALATTAQVKVLAVSERVDGPLVRSIRDLDVADLLGREPSPIDCAEIGGYLEGATVLVTGAGGSIGSEIARQVASYKPGRLLLLDRDETLLHDTAVGPLADAEPLLVDIRDRGRLCDLFERYRPDVVFHAAAQKHVPILERHPVEAVRTNVLGTWWLATTAAEFGCGRFVHISTDKAAEPCSVMGATKRAAEQIVFAIGRRHKAPFVAVRFGNVLGSRGSVVPTFLRQILDGGPVTVTDPDMTRYFMTIPEAVSLVLQSGTMSDDGRVLLLDMGEPVPILSLAKQMIRLAGLRPGEDIEIEITGARPGERLHESLHDDAEVIEPAGHPSIWGLNPRFEWRWAELESFVSELDQRCHAGDPSVTLVLEKMLHRSEVACALQSNDTERRIDLITSAVVDVREVSLRTTTAVD
jgi:FlaA1/EpsC-like NDP-sugar epimerase